jgi:phage shock protein C
MNRRLFRSRDDRILAGVAGGLADLWDADPSLVRVIWVILVPLTGGFALLAYVIMALVVPEEDEQIVASASFASPPSAATGSGDAADPTMPPAASVPPSTSVPPPDWRSARQEARAARRAARRERRGGPGSAGVLIGALLVIAGVYFLVREYIPDIDLNWLWPAALIALGVVVLLSAFQRPPGGPPDTDASP